MKRNVLQHKISKKKLKPGLIASYTTLIDEIGWWCRRHIDPNGFPSRELEETTRASPYHVAEHHPTRPESLQPYTERSSRSVDADVYVRRVALLVMHARKKEDTTSGLEMEGLFWFRRFINLYLLEESVPVCFERRSLKT